MGKPKRKSLKYPGYTGIEEKKTQGCGFLGKNSCLPEVSVIQQREKNAVKMSKLRKIEVVGFSWDMNSF